MANNEKINRVQELKGDSGDEVQSGQRADKWTRGGKDITGTSEVKIEIWAPLPHLSPYAFGQVSQPRSALLLTQIYIHNEGNRTSHEGFFVQLTFPVCYCVPDPNMNEIGNVCLMHQWAPSPGPDGTWLPNLKSGFNYWHHKCISASFLFLLFPSFSTLQDFYAMCVFYPLPSLSPWYLSIGRLMSIFVWPGNPEIADYINFGTFDQMSQPL